MEYETKVKLFVGDAPTEWIASAIVCLYDRDRLSRDDPLGMNITNSYGEAVFRFSADEYLDVDDRLGGALPELYVKVFSSDGECVVSTRSDALPNTLPTLIQVPIGRELAQKHRLLP